MVVAPVEPYLPEIMEGVVQRVNDYFEGLIAPYAFGVDFDYGSLAQVADDRIKQNKKLVLCWLVMAFTEDRDVDEYYAKADPYMIIATETDPNYTQRQRDSINFAPYLRPVYRQLLESIKEEAQLSSPVFPKHSRILIPFNGHGDANGSKAANLFGGYYDAIRVNFKELNIQNPKCNQFFRNTVH